MKPVAAIIADLHLTKNNSEYVFGLVSEVRDYCIENKIKIIIIAGDIFNERAAQNLSTLLGFKRILELLGDLEIFVIPGNHDKVNQDVFESYLNLYKDSNNFYLLDKIDVLSIKGLNIHFLPYFKDSAENHLSKTLEHLEGDNNVLISHISVNGVINNDGSKVDSGLKQSLFKPFKNVFLGHYHNRQDIGDNIHYIGSLYPQNFGEDNKKGFTLLFEDGSYGYHSIGFKKYVKKVFDLSEVNKNDIYRLKEKYTNSNHFVRFVFKGDDTQLATIDIPQFLEAGIDVKKEDSKITKSIEAADNNEFIEFNKSEIIKTYFEFCKNNKIQGNKMVRGLKYLKRL